MKKIEYQALKNEGLSEKALEVYSESDPITVYQREDGIFVVKGIIELEAANIEDVDRAFVELGEAYAE